MGKGEIARYEQFLLFPQCFQKACFPGASKGVIVWEWVKRVNSCSNNTMGMKNILQSTNHRHSKYPEKFNNGKEGKKSGRITGFRTIAIPLYLKRPKSWGTFVLSRAEK